MNKEHVPILLAALFPIYFAGLWVSVSFFLGRMGGWDALSKKYGVSIEPSGQKFTAQSAKIGIVNYNSCLTIHTTPEGFSLAMIFLFRIGHPPIFIPWREIHNARKKRRLWREWVVCEVEDPPIAHLQLPFKIFEGKNILIASNT
ncbi:MAG: hypothetical protein JWM04_508 [Verrucomicrobiales bacterium]|nr:hypothetical protein [Verrucomicrobiales bacterium]